MEDDEVFRDGRHSYAGNKKSRVSFSAVSTLHFDSQINPRDMLTVTNEHSRNLSPLIPEVKVEDKENQDTLNEVAASDDDCSDGTFPNIKKMCSTTSTPTRRSLNPFLDEEHRELTRLGERVLPHGQFGAHFSNAARRPSSLGSETSRYGAQSVAESNLGSEPDGDLTAGVPNLECLVKDDVAEEDVDMEGYAAPVVADRSSGCRDRSEHAGGEEVLNSRHYGRRGDRRGDPSLNRRISRFETSTPQPTHHALHLPDTPGTGNSNSLDHLLHAATVHNPRFRGEVNEDECQDLIEDLPNEGMKDFMGRTRKCNLFSTLDGASTELPETDLFAMPSSSGSYKYEARPALFTRPPDDDRNIQRLGTSINTTDSGELPTASEFRHFGPASSPAGPQLRLRTSLGGQKSCCQMPWDEFLMKCGIRLDGPERQPSEVFLETNQEAFPGYTPAMRKSLSDHFKRRAIKLKEIVEHVKYQTNQSTQEYEKAMRRWNDSTRTSWVVASLQQAMQDPEALKQFQHEIQCFYARASDCAHIQWYQAKQQWLQADLDLTRRFLGDIMQQINTTRQINTQLQRRLSEDHQRKELQRFRQKNRDIDTRFEVLDSDIQRLREHNERTKSRHSQDRLDIKRLTSELENEKRVRDQAKADLKKLRSRSKKLQIELANIQLDMLSKPFKLSKLTDQVAIFDFLGGLQLHVTWGVRGNPHRASLALPQSNGSTDAIRVLSYLREFYEDLVERVWYRLGDHLSRSYTNLRELAKPNRAANDGIVPPREPLPELLVPEQELPMVLHGLGKAAQRVKDQYLALKEVDDLCEDLGVSRLNPLRRFWRKYNLEFGHDFFAMGAELEFWYSHGVDKRTAGITKLAPDSVNNWYSYRCSLKFDLDPKTFPDEDRRPRLSLVGEDPELTEAIQEAQHRADAADGSFADLFVEVAQVIHDAKAPEWLPLLASH